MDVQVGVLKYFIVFFGLYAAKCFGGFMCKLPLCTPPMFGHRPTDQK